MQDADEITTVLTKKEIGVLRKALGKTYLQIHIDLAESIKYPEKNFDANKRISAANEELDAILQVEMKLISIGG